MSTKLKCCRTCRRAKLVTEFTRCGQGYRRDCNACLGKVTPAPPSAAASPVATPSPAPSVATGKACTCCGERLPLEGFEPAKNCRDGRRATCRRCMRLPVTERKGRRAELKAERNAGCSEKECRACGQSKPVEAFEPHPRGIGGRHSRCRVCRRDAERTRREQEIDMHRARVRAGYERHLDRRRADCREDKRLAAARPDARERRQRHDEAARQRHPERIEARDALRSAVARGEIAKPDHCSRCEQPTPKRQLHAHHPDYDRPLAVTWLCTGCHGNEHRALNAAARGEGTSIGH